MDFVNKIYEIIMYFINTISGLVKFFKGEEEESTTIIDDTETEE